MNQLTAVVLGASGLTGGLLVDELLNDKDYKTVRVLVKKIFLSCIQNCNNRF